jgi:APA family basic amino acid/polyamine antiporter
VLLRVLGVGFGIAVIIGNAIGAGILRAPGVVAEHLPDPWLFMTAWVVAGLYALLGSFQIAELGTMLPRSGGQYVYARHALGDYAGFVVGWSDWISTCGSTAAVSIVVGEFSAVLFPVFRGRAVLVAAAIAAIFALVQWRGVRWGSRAQTLTSAAKTFVFAALIAAAFGLDRLPSSPAVEADAARGGLALATGFLLALQAAIYTYDGWTGAVYFSEELETPSNDVPKSLVGGVFTIIAIYLLLNLALLKVLPISTLAGSDFAVGSLAGALFGRLGDPVFRSLTILSMLSAINAYHLMASRTLYAMSRDGLFFSAATSVNRGGTPTVSLLVGTVVALLFIAFGQTFERVITVLAFFFVANYTLSFASLFVLRWRKPGLARPYRAWGYPWTTALALAGSVAFLAGAVATDTRNSLFALALLAVSYPLFLLMKRS